MNKEMIKLGKLEFNLSELSEFLVKAKRNGYAGNGEKIRFDDGSKAYVFQEGNFHYTDTYSGSLQAPGFELVRWKNSKGPWIWFMSYSGGMLPKFWENESLTKETYSFLKEALLKVTPEQPFRGPESYVGREFYYLNHIQGNIKNFVGKERIFNQKEVVFLQNFVGGLVIPKIK